MTKNMASEQALKDVLVIKNVLCLTCLLKWHFYSPKQMFYDVNLLWCWWEFQYLFNGTLYNQWHLKNIPFHRIISICVASPKGGQGKCRWQICAMIICNCGAKSQMFFPTNFAHVNAALDIEKEYWELLNHYSSQFLENGQINSYYWIF